MGRRTIERNLEDEQLEQLPVSRIKTIMKSSPEVEGIRKEALFLVNKATEFFIQFLSSTAYARTKGTGDLDYNFLAEIVQDDKRLTFMADLFPKRITYKEYKELIEKKRKKKLLAKAKKVCDFGTYDDDLITGRTEKLTSEERPYKFSKSNDSYYVMEQSHASVSDLSQQESPEYQEEDVDTSEDGVEVSNVQTQALSFQDNCTFEDNETSDSNEEVETINVTDTVENVSDENEDINMIDDEQSCSD